MRASHKDNPARMMLNPDQAQQAATLIEKAFVWDETVEGHDFWQDVVEKLQEITETYKEN